MKKRKKSEIVQWLREEGKGDRLIDLAWDVDEVDENFLQASHPDLPFTIGIQFADRFVGLLLLTDLETAVMDPEKRLEIYRKLLIFNDENPMVKAMLSGRNDVVAFRTDMDLVSLSKEEFNDALITLLIAYRAFRREILGITPEEEMEKIIEFIASELREKSEDEVVKMLVERGGLSEEDAKELVDKIKKEMRMTPPPNIYG